ncbi:MAG: alpha/beta fold hydrolase, partial [Acidimicrobiales bacterium]
FMRGTIGDKRWERLPARTRRQRLDEGKALAAEMASLRTGEAPFVPSWVSVPTIIVRGSESLTHHREAAEALARLIPGAELSEIRGADHGAHLSHPEELASLVRVAVERSGLP